MSIKSLQGRRSVHVLGIPTFVIFQYMHASQAGQHFILRTSFEL